MWGLKTSTVMKKLALLFVFVFVAGFGVAQAQTDQGNIMVGGLINFSSQSGETTVDGTSTDNPTTTNFGINPLGGYFVTDNLAVGVDIGFMSESTNDNGDPETITRSNMIQGGVFGRYYLRPADMVGIYGQLGVGFGSGSSETEVDGTTTDGPDRTLIAAGISPGITIFPSESVGIDFRVGNIGYNSLTEKQEQGGVETENTTNTLEFNVDLTTVGVGVFFFF